MSVLKSKKKEKAPKNLLTFASKANKQINKQKNYAKIISTNKIFLSRYLYPNYYFFHALLPYTTRDHHHVLEKEKKPNQDLLKRYYSKYK